MRGRIPFTLLIAVFAIAAFAARAGADEALPMSPKTEAALRRVLAEEVDSQQVRAATAFGAARVVTPETVQALLRALSDDSPEVRAASCFALGRGGAPAAQDALRKAAADPAWIVRIEALRALAAFPPSDANTAAALAALADPDSAVRQAALGMLGHAGVKAAAAKGLSGFLQTDAPPAERAGALDALALRQAAIGFDKALQNALADRDSGVRAAALRAVAGCKVALGRERAAALLKDREPHVRREAVAAVAALEVNVIPAVSPLATDPDSTVRRAVADALAGTGPESLPALRIIMEDNYRLNRRAASAALLATVARFPAARAMILEEAQKRIASDRRSDRIEGLYLLGSLKERALAAESFGLMQPRFPAGKAGSPKAEPPKADDATPESAAADGAAGGTAGGGGAVSFRDPANADLAMTLWMAGQCGETELGAAVTGFLDAPDMAARLQAATAVGLLKHEPAVPVIAALLKQTRSEMGMTFFVYGGEPRVALVRSLRQIGTAEALKLVDDRFRQTRPFEDDQILAEAADQAVALKRTDLLGPMRILYRTKEFPDESKRVLATAERKLSSEALLEMPPEPDSVFGQFFLQVRER